MEVLIGVMSLIKDSCVATKQLRFQSKSLLIMKGLRKERCDARTRRREALVYRFLIPGKSVRSTVCTTDAHPKADRAHSIERDLTGMKTRAAEPKEYDLDARSTPC